MDVVILLPDTTVESLQDEVADGQIDAARDAAHAVYGRLGSVRERSYGEDFDNAVDDAAELLKGSTSAKLVVVPTDFVCNDRPKAQAALQRLAEAGHMVVAVNVNNQPTDDLKAWATWLDDESPFADAFDVRTTADLHTNGYDEVGPWAAKHGVTV